MKTAIRLICLLFLLMPVRLAAQEEQIADDFVISSIVCADPGDGLYARLGHVAIRMRCPEYDLDYVFSYESEGASRKVLKFLAGKLKMGLYAIPFDEYIGFYVEEGRGVREYALNLPIEAKRNLWRVLDDHMMEGVDLPYNYILGGCANSTLRFLKEGIEPLKIQYGPWPESFSLTRREITSNKLSKYTWIRCFLHLICNGEIDAPCTKEEKVIMPEDLIEVLMHASVGGVALMAVEPVELLPSGFVPRSARITPLMVALLLLLLTLVCGLLGSSVMDYVLLVLQTGLGLVTVYLVCFSSLVCTEWSWLIIPFNPLPLIFWKWRRRWQLPYGIVCLVWAGVMAFWPHALTDWTFVVLAVALAVSYFGRFLSLRKN